MYAWKTKFLPFEGLFGSLREGSSIYQCVRWLYSNWFALYDGNGDGTKKKWLYRFIISLSPINIYSKKICTKWVACTCHFLVRYCTCTDSKLVWNCEMMYWSLIIKVDQSPTHVVESIFSWSLKSLLTSHLQYFCEFYNDPPQLTSWTSWSNVAIRSWTPWTKRVPIFTWLLFRKTFQNLLSVHNGVFPKKSTEMHNGRDFLNRVQLN